MKYILFDAITKILSARYDSEIHGNSIPEGAIQVEEHLFFRTIDEQEGIWTLVDDEVVKIPFPALTLPELKQSKLNKINRDFEQAMSAVVSGYPEKEISSWSKQEAEARAYLANNTATTPLIDALSTARNLPKAELVTRIIAKADLFAGVSGQLIGYRQSLEDQLNALPATATSEDVEAIAW